MHAPASRPPRVPDDAPAAPPRRRRVVTPAMLAANRANAAKSTGPRSAAGRARSARNALKHGGRAAVDIDGANEPIGAFADHLAATLADFNPADVIEARLVCELAEWDWRIRRVHAALATEAWARRDARAAAGDPEPDRIDPDLILRYAPIEARLGGRWVRAMSRLLRYRLDRRKAARAYGTVVRVDAVPPRGGGPPIGCHRSRYSETCAVRPPKDTGLGVPRPVAPEGQQIGEARQAERSRGRAGRLSGGPARETSEPLGWHGLRYSAARAPSDVEKHGQRSTAAHSTRSRGAQKSPSGWVLELKSLENNGERPDEALTRRQAKRTRDAIPDEARGVVASATVSGAPGVLGGHDTS